MNDESPGSRTRRGSRRVLVVAGESSGDHHAAGLVESVRPIAEDVAFEAVGGDALRRAGARVIHEAREIAVVGISEVFERLPAIRAVMRDLTRRLREEPPDAVLLVDFPDFNLRVARKAAALGVPVVYFVSPQVWAWRSGRVELIRRVVDKMIVLFPFEEEFYRENGVPVVCVGHPLADGGAGMHDAARSRERLGLARDTPVFGLLPGSREGELRRHLDPLLETARLVRETLPAAHFVLPVAETLDEAAVRARVETTGLPLTVGRGQFRELAAACDAAVAASGTATLELAVLGVPSVVVYRLSWLTWAIGRAFVRVPHVSLVNLVAGRRLIPELLQGDFTPERAAGELLRLGRPGPDRERVLAGLVDVRERLGAPGAYDRAAGALVEVLDASQRERGESPT